MRAVGRWSLILAGALYTNWLLQLLLPVSAAPGSVPVSTLSAPGQPVAWLFRTGDATAGVLLVLGAVLVWVAGRRAPRTALLAAALVGATNVALALLPEECAEPGVGADGLPTCSDERLLSDPHTALSLVQDLSAATLAAVLLWAAVRRTPRRPALAALAAVVLLTWTSSWLTGGGAFLGDPVDGFGWFQRAFVTSTALLLVALGRQR